MTPAAIVAFLGTLANGTHEIIVEDRVAVGARKPDTALTFTYFDKRITFVPHAPGAFVVPSTDPAVLLGYNKRG